MWDHGSQSAGGDSTTAETSLLQIKTNFESNLNRALRDYNVTADRHSEAVDTIQRTVSAAGWQVVGGTFPGTPCGVSIPVVALGFLLHHELLSLGGDAGEMGAVPREVRAGGLLEQW